METRRSFPRRLEWILRDEVGVEEFDLRPGLLGGRAEPLEAVGRDRRHPLERIRMNEEDACRGPGDGRPG